MYKTIILLIIFLSILYFYFIKINKDLFTIQEPLTDNIYFLSFHETSKFLLNDTDDYVKNMTDIDIYARKTNSKDEYKKNISDCCISFTINEKNILIKCCKIADDFLRKYKIEYLDGNDIANIKWKFSLTRKYENFEYEEGMPHTRKDIIFLPKKIFNDKHSDIINTLIHEKVHIYQRYNKNKIDILLNKMNYKKVDKTNLDLTLKRSNPDLDDDIYQEPVYNKIMICQYSNNKPYGLNDVQISHFSTEHPYELIAYNIANEYNKSYIRKIK